MRYRHLEFIQLSLEAKQSLVELGLDCRTVNLLNVDNLRELCEQIKQCNQLSRLNIIYPYINEEIAWAESFYVISQSNRSENCTPIKRCMNVFLSNIICYSVVASMSLCLLAYNVAYNNKILDKQNTYVLFTLGMLFGVTPALISWIELNTARKQDSILYDTKLRRMEMLSNALSKCSLQEGEPKFTSYTDNEVELQTKEYFLGIKVSELLDNVKKQIAARNINQTQRENINHPPESTRGFLSYFNCFRIQGHRPYISMSTNTVNNSHNRNNIQDNISHQLLV